MPWPTIKRGIANYDFGDYQLAIENYDEAIRLDPHLLIGRWPTLTEVRLVPYSNASSRWAPNSLRKDVISPLRYVVADVLEGTFAPLLHLNSHLQSFSLTNGRGSEQTRYPVYVAFG